MILTAERIKRFAPKARADFVQALVAGQRYLDAADINTPLRIQHFMAQIYHESMGLSRNTEIWGPTPAQKRYEGRKDLGNTIPGDGKRYMGRGLIQITGRANYREFGDAIGLDIENHPEKAAEPLNSVRIACAYWTDRNINASCDRDDVIAVTKKINGGTTGLAARKTALARAKKLFVGDVPAMPLGLMAAPVTAKPPKALLMTYQQRLKDLGFYGLKVDGLWGDGTSGAIAAFKHANGLGGEATFDPEMVALLMSDEAQAKTVSEERANATADDIRAESPIVRKAERGETAAVVQAAVPAAGGLAWYASQAVEYLKPVREFLEDVPVGVWVGGVVALAAYLWWQSRQIKEARVAMHRNAEVA